MKVYLTFGDMQDDDDADDMGSKDIVLHDESGFYSGPIRWNGLDWRPYKDFYLDLSPLSKFLHAPEGVRVVKAWVVPREVAADGMIWIATGCGDGTEEWAHRRENGTWVRMYGYPFEPEETQQPKPEKSPIDKAIDDMMEKRKAKREAGNSMGQEDAIYEKLKANEKASDALGNAMSKLTHWEVSFADRLTPYRGPVL